MKKVLVTIEMEIDENELGKIEDYQNDYEKNMTVEKWIDGLEILRTDDGNISIGNKVEEYYNQNLGTTNVLRGIKVKGYEIQ